MRKLQVEYSSIWKNEKGNIPQVTTHKDDTFEEMKRKMLNQCKAVGRYHIGLNWREGKVAKGHVITAERLQDGDIVFYDPQDGSFVNFDEYGVLFDIDDYIESIKVDKLIVDVEKLRAISRPSL